MSYKNLYTLKHYQYSFTQPFPAYGKKDMHGWKTVHQPLSQEVIQQHLRQEISIGTYGRWYPQFGIIDLDDVEIHKLYEIRSRLAMDKSNSLIFTSESPNSYHIYFKPVRRGKLMNLNLYLKCMAATREVMDIEIYPQSHHLIRLPFGKGQKLLDEYLPFEVDYQVGMDMLYRLEEYDVEQLPYLPWADDLFPTLPNPSSLPTLSLQKGWKHQGLTLLQSGLTASGTRVESLKRVIYFYWSQNVPLESTIKLTCAWIDHHHHGYSKDYLNNPQEVYQQIEELTYWIYQHFDHHYILPDAAHIIDKGFVTPTLTRDLVIASQGKLPLLKFSLKLFGYLAARNNHGNKIAIHRDRLVEMSSTHNYIPYLDHFKRLGYIKRDARYKVGHYAKGICLLHHHPSYQEAILWDEARPASTLQEILPQVYTPQEYALQLKHLQIDRRTIHMQIKEIWEDQSNTFTQPIHTKKHSTQERIREYIQKHPSASHQDIAQALDISTKTIQRFKKHHP